MLLQVGQIVAGFVIPVSQQDHLPGNAGAVRHLAQGSALVLFVITNLDPDRFPLAALKALYARRWGIETSFRSLKYAVGLIHLHAKKPDLVLQEVFASFLIFNFTLIRKKRQQKQTEAAPSEKGHRKGQRAEA